MSVPESKLRLRSQLRAARAALSVDEVQTRSAAVHANLLLQPEFWAAPLLLTYVSIGNEVDTRTLITTALAEGRGVAVPRLGPSRNMDWVEIAALDALQPGELGIPQPAADLPVACIDADALVLVPGIAFAPNGHRIGFGGGYFDRFLDRFAGVSIGLAYDFQVVPDWPAAPHDRPVHIVTTETAVYRPVAPSA